MRTQGTLARQMRSGRQWGADIVANAVSALEKYPVPIIMIDMGTATIISYISEKRTYEGGLMFPGVRLSLDALSHHTAQLPNISLEHPKQLIGTENRKPLSFASVSITLDNSDHKLPVDYNEVTVARRLYRSGESEYLINGDRKSVV